MILVNLLPPEFRKQTTRLGGTWPSQSLLKILGAGFLALTLFFYVQYLFEIREFKKLNKEWMGLQEEVRRVDQIKTDMESGSKGERTFLERYIASSFRTTAILSSVSQLIPDSIWLVEVKILRQPKENTLLLKGVSVPSREKSSVQAIEKYLKDLKEKFPSGAELVLTTSRQQKDRSELTLFTAVFKWA